MTPKLTKTRDELARDAENSWHAVNGPSYTAKHFEEAYSLGFDAACALLLPVIEALILVSPGEADYNSAWSMICLMAEGEGSDAKVYQTMAKAVHAKLKPALKRIDEVIGD